HWRRRFRPGQTQTRQVSCARQSVIHQTAGEELAILVVDDFLEECLSHALDDSPLDLSIHEQRIDDLAAVVHCVVSFDFDLSCLQLNFHHADVGSEWKGKIPRLKTGFGDKPGIYVFWKPASLVSFLRNLFDREAFFRHPFDAKAPFRKVQIVSIHLQEMGGELSGFFFDLLRRFIDGDATHRRRPAAKGADSFGHGSGVSMDYRNIIQLDTKFIGDYLCEGRLLTLAMR